MLDKLLLTISEHFDTFWVLILLAELIWLWRRGGFTGSRLREAGTNVVTAVLFVIATVLTVGVTYAIAFKVSALVPWAMPTTPLTALFALVLADFVYYWEHRFSHEIRAWWAASHSVHHSSPHFDATTAGRISFVDVFLAPFTAFIALLTGVPPLLYIAASALVLAYQGWIHTEMIGKLGWFDRIFNSPSNHRVHHASDERYLDKNYGGILIIWDRLFGTWQPEVHTPTYGLTEPIDSARPWIVHTAELTRLFATLRTAPSLGAALRYALVPRGWADTTFRPVRKKGA